jgi:membrane peptidoglycan carboxypeptidase
MLAAIPQSPALNPINNPEAAKARQELVLDAMVREGMISEETAESSKALPVTVVNSIAERFDIIAPHFALYVQQQLEEMFGPELVLGGGLRVYTTLDLTYQQQAECVANAHVNRLSGAIGPGLPADEQSSCDALTFLPNLNPADQGVDHEVSNAAVVMLDPRTAEIKAMVGSLNYWDASIDGSFNVAVDGLRQPGSSFKPFTTSRRSARATLLPAWCWMWKPTSARPTTASPTCRKTTTASSTARCACGKRWPTATTSPRCRS